jgi:hypothetical protein
MLIKFGITVSDPVPELGSTVIIKILLKRAAGGGYGSGQFLATNNENSTY